MEANMAMNETTVWRLASLCDARRRCVDSPAGSHLKEAIAGHDERLARIFDAMPHGSGLDGDVTVDLERSGFARILIDADWHSMNGDGFYCGWHKYRVTILPDFGGIDVKVRGANTDGTADYLGEVFREWALSPAPTEAVVARTAPGSPLGAGL
jgi:hypothetical protein